LPSPCESKWFRSSPRSDESTLENLNLARLPIPPRGHCKETASPAFQTGHAADDVITRHWQAGQEKHRRETHSQTADLPKSSEICCLNELRTCRRMNHVFLRQCQQLIMPPCNSLGILAGLMAGILLTGLLVACDRERSAGSEGAGDVKGTVFESIVNLDGEPVDPFQSAATNKATVLVFLGVECPISNRYVPELRRLQAKFTKENIGWWFVYPGTNYSLQAMRRHVRDFSVTGDVACDRQLSLARRAQVRITPEAAVFLPDGRLVYHGRIDDRFPELTVERPAPTRRDLEEALGIIVAGGRVTPMSTQAVGCFIPGLP